MKAKRTLALVLMIVMLAALSVPSMALVPTVNGFWLITADGYEWFIDVSNITSTASPLRTKLIELVGEILADETGNAKLVYNAGGVPVEMDTSKGAASIKTQLATFDELPQTEKDAKIAAAEALVENARTITEVKEDGTIVAREKDGTIVEVDKDGKVTVKPSIGLTLSADGCVITAKVVVVNVDEAETVTVQLLDAANAVVEEKKNVVLEEVAPTGTEESRYEATVTFADTEKEGAYNVIAALDVIVGFEPVKQSIVVKKPTTPPPPETVAITGVEVQDATTVVVTLDAAMAGLTDADFIVEVNVDAEDDETDFTVDFTVAPGTGNTTYIITLAKALEDGDVVTVTGEGTKVTGTAFGEYEAPTPEYTVVFGKVNPTDSANSIIVKFGGVQVDGTGLVIIWDEDGGWWNGTTYEGGKFEVGDTNKEYAKTGSPYILIVASEFDGNVEDYYNNEIIEKDISYVPEDLPGIYTGVIG